MRDNGVYSELSWDEFSKINEPSRDSTRAAIFLLFKKIDQFVGAVPVLNPAGSPCPVAPRGEKQKTTRKITKIMLGLDFLRDNFKWFPYLSLMALREASKLKIDMDGDGTYEQSLGLRVNQLETLGLEESAHALIDGEASGYVASFNLHKAPGEAIPEVNSMRAYPVLLMRYSCGRQRVKYKRKKGSGKPPSSGY